MKWWEDFVDSAINFISKWYDIKFVIAWDWDDRDKLLDKIKNQSNIFYLWHIENMPDFYNILDLFVIPSYWEAMWLTEIESMATWKPVIASNVEALNEIIIDWYNWLFFNVKDSKNLSDKIVKLYDDKSLRETLIKNWLNEVKKYSLDNYLIEINKIYEEL
jgi:glycosyltransferase involved in cell wall biosynthesis